MRISAKIPQQNPPVLVPNLESYSKCWKLLQTRLSVTQKCEEIKLKSYFLNSNIFVSFEIPNYVIVLR